MCAPINFFLNVGQRMNGWFLVSCHSNVPHNGDYSPFAATRWPGFFSPLLVLRDTFRQEIDKEEEERKTKEGEKRSH